MRGTGSTPTYCSDKCRRAVKARRQREYSASKRASRPRPALKESDTHPDRRVCAAEGCSKLLTVAAVRGQSEHCSRECAGFLTPPSAYERELLRDLKEAEAVANA